MRFGQKLHKYCSSAEQHGFQFMPFIFPHNGQMHSQIDHKLRLVDGKVAAVKRQSICWRLWVRYISAVINRTARNIHRKMTKTVNSSNSALRQAILFTCCDETFSSASKLAELVWAENWCAASWSRRASTSRRWSIPWKRQSWWASLPARGSRFSRWYFELLILDWVEATGFILRYIVWFYY